MTQQPFPAPDSETYDDVVTEQFDLAVGGGTTPTFLARPTAPGPHPGVVIGQEGTGPNSFIRRIAATLAHLGFVAIVADYYRGTGPADPEDYSDIDDMVAHIDALDFRVAVQDELAALEFLAARDDVDATRIASWGYCTGATMAMFLPCLRHDLAAAVCFFPSQPWFETIDARHPVHAMDLLWNVQCPIAFMIGDLDVVLPPERLPELRQRFDQWGVDGTIFTYPDAQHAFCAEGATFHNAEAAAQSWQDAVGFLTKVLLPG
ncbi:MAG: dienelactone hydrolase family protein [Acidimicrobiia bacterium]